MGIFSQYNLYNMLKCNMQLGNKFEPNNFHLLGVKKKLLKATKTKKFKAIKPWIGVCMNCSIAIYIAYFQPCICTVIN